MPKAFIKVTISLEDIIFDKDGFVLPYDFGALAIIFNPENIKAHERLSDACDERLSGVKAITHCIITQRFLSEHKMLKELSLSRVHLEELYKKYMTGPAEFKKVITPRKRYF